MSGKRIEGPTPAGGAYAVAFFQDDANNIVAKEDATRIEIIEYDNNDQPIHRTYMVKSTDAHTQAAVRQ